MLSLRTAARLLADAGTLQALTPLARMLGCDGPPHSLDARLRDAIGAPPGEGWRINVAPGPEPLRALLVEAPRESALRDAVAHIARRLAARAPDALWALLATQADGAQLVIASWSAARHPPRVVALTVDRAHVVDSDADTLRLLAAAAGDAPLLAHGAWLDILGRDALTRRFYRVMERTVAGLAESATGGGSGEARRELALLCLSRLLFLSFIEAKGWLDEDRGFLARAFTGCPGNAHERLLLPLFFGTLNTPVSRRAERARRFGRIPFLNGGLFARTPLERQLPRARFPDHALAAVFDDLLLRYRFTAREDHASWSDAAVDPEMLGRAFESLMASDDRRRSGAFYTPHRLVAHVTEQALRTALAAHAGEDAARRALANEPVSDHEARRLRCGARELRVLDPACGSGAFLVHALETLADLAVTLGDTRPLAAIRRERLTAAIFGVDVNPMAVWLCELRLWLSTVIECDETDPMRVPSLPNLDRHIRTGDALMGGAFASCGLEPAGGVEARRLAALRGRYARATGVRKRTLARALEREERLAADRAVRSELVAAESRRRELVACVRAPDLFGQHPGPSRLERAQLAALRLRVRQLRARQRALAAGAGLPFAFATHFPDVAASRGFSVLLGNPPWVRPHHVDARTRAALRERFATARGAAWAEGARDAGAGPGFAAQVDLAALFVERGLSLLHDGGTLALLVPAKLWRALAGGGVRRLLAHHARLRALEDWSRSPPAFDAAVYPSLVVATRGAPAPQAADACVAVAEHAPGTSRRWSAPAWALPLTADPASPWPLVPPDVRGAFDRVAAAGPPLAHTPFGRPELGVKTGCNAAFVVRGDDCVPDACVRVSAGDRHGLVERGLLRPLVRGETLTPWRLHDTGERILWTHDALGRPLPALPPATHRWLRPWRARLAARSDGHGAARWWMLHRTDGADHRAPRVVWSDFGRVPRAAVIAADDPTVALNTCYVLRCPTLADARALAALLNSALAAAWLEPIAEPARGGYRRYLAWTMARLPLPADWPRARALLAPMAERAEAGHAPPPDALLGAVLCAYGLAPDDVWPLLAWQRR